MVKSFKCMAAQLLNLIQLKPTPVDRQTGERQTKLGKISQSCFSSFPSGCERKFVRRDGRTAGDRFQLRAVVRVAISAQSVVSRVADIFPEFFWPFWKQQKGSRKHRGPKPRNASSQVECSH